MYTYLSVLTKPFTSHSTHIKIDFNEFKSAKNAYFMAAVFMGHLNWK